MTPVSKKPEVLPPSETITILDRVRSIMEAIKNPTPAPVNVNITNEQPGISVETQAREYPINVQPTPVTIENIMPEMKQQEINVQVSPTPLTIENKITTQQEVPVVNVNVSPTPVTVENKNAIYVPENVPDVVIEQPKPRNVKITRDAGGKISGMKEEK